MTRRANSRVIPNIDSTAMSTKRRFPTHPLFAILFIAIEGVKRPAVEMQDQRVQVVEHVIDSAHRTSDFLRDSPDGEAA